MTAQLKGDNTTANFRSSRGNSYSLGQILLFAVYQSVKFCYLILAVFNWDQRSFVKVNKNGKSDINHMTLLSRSQL